ncbi:MAG: hypothetical protein LBC17_01350 [Lactobacillaceae bacterium]|jgi:hypothetical protein|nr:hypothetical protein [Lactobacillaceae bacterium]
MESKINNQIFSTGFLGLSSNNEFLINYISVLCSSPEFINNKDIASTGTTMMSINNETFMGLFIPKISMSEMVEFGRKIDDLIKINYCIDVIVSKLELIKSQLLKLLIK